MSKLVFKNINKSILPVATGVTIGLTVLAISGVIGSTIGSLISGAIVPMSGYLIGECVTIGISLCSICGLCYLSYKQDSIKVDDIVLGVDKTNPSNVIDPSIIDQIKDCEIVLNGDNLEDVTFS